MLRILHFTDLHCTAERSQGGFAWKKVLAGEYARRIKLGLEAQGVPGIADLMLVTGDFVHCNADALHEVKGFLGEVASQFKDENGESPDIVICPGNHDYDRKADNRGQFIEARSQYMSFRSSIHEDCLRRSHNREKQIEFEHVIGEGYPKKFLGAEFVSPLDRFPGLPILSLDMTVQHFANSAEARKLGDRVNHPKPWTSDEEHLTETFVKVATFVEACKSEYPCIILCHYPVGLSNRQATKHAHNTSFDRSAHEAPMFRGLIEQIHEKTQKPVLLFCGDVHEPDEETLDIPSASKRKVWQFVTGRAYPPQGEQVPVPWTASVRMVYAKPNGKNSAKDFIKTVCLAYENPDGGFNPSKGYWKPYTGGGIPKSWIKPRSKDVAPSHSALKVGPEVTEQPTSEDNEIDSFLQQGGLVELRRIKSGRDSISRLSSVRMGPLMNHAPAREFAVAKIAEWMRKRRKELNKVLLVGLDCWGYALATRLCHKLHTQCVGISVRGLDDKELSEEIRRQFTDPRTTRGEFDEVCSVTDVIATGGTIENVKAMIAPWLPNVKFTCAAIIRSLYSEKSGIPRDVEVFGVLDKFKIPILGTDELPDSNILPAQSFGLH